MVFSSSVFLFLFLPLILLAYYLPIVKSRKYKNCVLLLFSIGFYWYGEPVFVWLMLISIVINWLLGLLVDKFREHKKWVLFLSCIYNIGILFVFKYMSFCSENLAVLFDNDSLIINIALPIGISFFTFQMMSYVFDVANNSAKPQKNLFGVALYVSMFPQLIAGPIVRYETVADEIESRNENWAEFSEGFCRFIKGLAKKVILSNNIAILADLIFSYDLKSVSGATAWLGAIAYSFQIFYDFSGYSDMAIGLGKMFGFHFLENFNFPYISKSISEFWRRWHISMGTWFRDYVYFPLGGSRVKSRTRLIFNLFVVWLCTGIWHGANWTFIIWGMLYFVLIVIEKYTDFPKKIGVLAHVYTMFFVVIGWVIFRAENLNMAREYILTMFLANGNSLLDGAFLQLLKQFWGFLLLALVFSLPTEKYLFRNTESVAQNLLYALTMIVLLVLCLVYVIKGGFNPFIYFNF